MKRKRRQLAPRQFICLLFVGPTPHTASSSSQYNSFLFAALLFDCTLMRCSSFHFHYRLCAIDIGIGRTRTVPVCFLLSLVWTIYRTTSIWSNIQHATTNNTFCRVFSKYLHRAIAASLQHCFRFSFIFAFFLHVSLLLTKKKEKGQEEQFSQSSQALLICPLSWVFACACFEIMTKTTFKWPKWNGWTQYWPRVRLNI